MRVRSAPPSTWKFLKNTLARKYVSVSSITSSSSVNCSASAAISTLESACVCLHARVCMRAFVVVAVDEVHVSFKRILRPSLRIHTVCTKAHIQRLGSPAGAGGAGPRRLVLIGSIEHVHVNGISISLNLLWYAGCLQNITREIHTNATHRHVYTYKSGMRAILIRL
jgi:hypothetical protein